MLAAFSQAYNLVLFFFYRRRNTISEFKDMCCTTRGCKLFYFFSSVSWQSPSMAVPMACHSTDMGFRGTVMGVITFHGRSWCFMVVRGFSRTVMGFDGTDCPMARHEKNHGIAIRRSDGSTMQCPMALPWDCYCRAMALPTLSLTLSQG